MENRIELYTGEILKTNEFGIWCIQEHELAIELPIELTDIIKTLNSRIIKMQNNITVESLANESDENNFNTLGLCKNCKDKYDIWDIEDSLL